MSEEEHKSHIDMVAEEEDEAIETWISNGINTAPINESKNSELVPSPPSLKIPAVSQTPSKKASFSLIDECSAVLREWRHNTCLMTPICTFIMLAAALTSVTTMVCYVPQFLLGLFFGPLIKRSNFLVEFIYPFGFIGRLHLFMVHFIQKRQSGAKVNAPHSRATEQRFQVIKGRVYVHTIPFFLDNLAYLIIFCPPFGICSDIVGYIVDCGDAEEVRRAVERVRYLHYGGRPIHISAILSTHKHHDHTGGNQVLYRTCYPESLNHIYGGAVERVPFVTDLLKNGDKVPVPEQVKDICEIEVIATPSHTRGSVVYALRCTDDTERSATVQLFTGDVMFSAGGGLPFEADILVQKDKETALKPSAGMNSIERCFAEIIFRVGVKADCVTVFPGHEYSVELLRRQFDIKAEYGKVWYRLSPAVFFETASQYFIAQHKRTLPRGTKLLTIPSLLEKEISINPHFRSLVHRAEMFIQAVKVWKQFYDEDMGNRYSSSLNNVKRKNSSVMPKNLGFTGERKDSSLSKPIRNNSYLSSGNTMQDGANKAPWILTTDDLKRSVFSTLYSADLDGIIEMLLNKEIDGPSAANELIVMRQKLKENVVIRKPVPNTTPSDKNKKLILLAVAILGAGPTAMTRSDAVRMNLPQPTSNPSNIMISKSRLLTVLSALGVLSSLTKAEVVEAINLLWQVSQNGDLKLEEELHENSLTNAAPVNYSSMNHPSGEMSDDWLELSDLQATFFGPTKPPCWVGMCHPCSRSSVDSPVAKQRRQSGAELVRHEVESCYICKSIVGYPKMDRCKHVGSVTATDFLDEDVMSDSVFINSSWKENA
jgi:glyoxylase-like metal-dependent hydrolase (beta-lactamase superfamily II)